MGNIKPQVDEILTETVSDLRFCGEYNDAAHNIWHHGAKQTMILSEVYTRDEVVDELMDVVRYNSDTNKVTLAIVYLGMMHEFGAVEPTKAAEVIHERMARIDDIAFWAAIFTLPIIGDSGGIKGMYQTMKEMEISSVKEYKARVLNTILTKITTGAE